MLLLPIIVALLRGLTEAIATSDDEAFVLAPRITCLQLICTSLSTNAESRTKIVAELQADAAFMKAAVKATPTHTHLTSIGLTITVPPAPAKSAGGSKKKKK
jgi:hypothetical protein